MSKLVRLATLLIVIIANSLAAAGEVVEVRVLEGKATPPPVGQPEGQSAEVPPDAKLIASIEALADTGGEFSAKCVVGAETLRLKGRVTAAGDGKHRVQVEFSRRSPAGLQEVTSVVSLLPKAQHVISGTTADGVARLIVLRLKPDREPEPEDAE